MTRLTRFALPLAAAALAILGWVFSPPDFADRTSTAPSATGAAWQARLVRAADGDSFTVRRTDSEREVELRLYGVDAPETGQAYGQASRRSLLHMAEGRVLTVDPVEIDAHGRTVAVVFAAGDAASLNERQIEQGMAWYYGYFCQKPFCGAWRAKEQQARSGRAGLWRDKNPVAPRAWRNEHPR